MGNQTKTKFPTFEELAALDRKEGFEMAPLVDYQREGLRMLVRRGGASLTAYIGVPESHPLADFNYDDLPVEVHGGLTFGSTFKDVPGWFFYGWDYAHLGDRSFYDVKYREERDGHAWTVEEVRLELEEAEWDFRKLARLAERIKHERA